MSAKEKGFRGELKKYFCEILEVYTRGDILESRYEGICNGSLIRGEIKWKIDTRGDIKEGGYKGRDNRKWIRGEIKNKVDNRKMIIKYMEGNGHTYIFPLCI